MTATEGTPRILIVEDSPAMRHLLSLAVKRVPGAVVEQAADGVAALKKIKEARAAYDLIFLDLNMPVMDGMKLLGMLQREPDRRPRGLCIVTTETSEEIEAQARALGATHFLRKPVNRRVVEKVVAEVFGFASPR